MAHCFIISVFKGVSDMIKRCHVFTIVCKERELINSDTEAEKKGKKVLPNVEDEP